VPAGLGWDVVDHLAGALELVEARARLRRLDSVVEAAEAGDLAARERAWIPREPDGRPWTEQDRDAAEARIASLQGAARAQNDPVEGLAGLSERARERLLMGTGAVLSVSAAAALLPCNDAEARRWLEAQGLARRGPGGKRMVAWAAVVERLSPPAKQPAQSKRPKARGPSAPARVSLG